MVNEKKKSVLLSSSYLWKMQSLIKFDVPASWDVTDLCCSCCSCCMCACVCVRACLFWSNNSHWAEPHWPKHIPWKQSFKLSNVNTLGPELHGLLLSFMQKQWEIRKEQKCRNGIMWEQGRRGTAQCAPPSVLQLTAQHTALLWLQAMVRTIVQIISTVTKTYGNCWPWTQSIACPGQDREGWGRRHFLIEGFVWSALWIWQVTRGAMFL